MDAQPIPERRVIERALCGAGLTRRQAKRLISVGWPALVDERRAEIDEVRAQLEDLQEAIASAKIAPVPSAA